MKVMTTALAAILAAAPAYAHAPDEARWIPWLGCWELVTEDVRDSDGSGALPADRSGARTAASEGAGPPRVCASPAAGGGATFTTTIAGETAIERTVVPDGAERPLEEGECRGTERAEWSGDGVRLYSSARLTCPGDQGQRRVSALSLLGPDGTWLDLQGVEIGGREDVRVRRYRRVESAAGVPAVLATRLTLDDVAEASGKVSPGVVEAALIETGAGFDLSGRTLLDLDEAGVPGSVIDVMVALSYPERFVVERARGGRGGGTIFLSDPLWLDYGFYAPFYGSPYFPYYYSPFAYSYYGLFDPRFFGGGFITVPADGSEAPEPRPSGEARAVDGRGYTRVRPREPDSPGASGAPSSRRVPPTAATSSSPGESSSSGSSSGSSGSSGSSASPQGFSSGGSGGDTGRTAVPR